MPVVTADQIVMSSTGAELLLTDLTSVAAVAGTLVGVKVDLFENNITPTPQLALSAYTIPGADWTGYVQKALTGWGAQAIGVDGRVSIFGQPILEWVGPVGGAGPTIYGCLIRSAATGNPLLYAAKFITPVSMVDATHVLDLVISFTIPNLQ